MEDLDGDKESRREAEWGRLATELAGRKARRYQKPARQYNSRLPGPPTSWREAGLWADGSHGSVQSGRNNHDLMVGVIRSDNLDHKRANMC